MPRPSHFSRFGHPKNIGCGVQIINLLIMKLFPSPVNSPLLGPNILLSTLFSNTLSLRSPLSVNDQVSHPYKFIVQCILIVVFLDSNLMNGSPRKTGCIITKFVNKLSVLRYKKLFTFKRALMRASHLENFSPLLNGN